MSMGKRTERMAMAEENYQQTIARMRQERSQRERLNQLENIQTDYREAVRERDEAAARGDMDEFELRDTDCERLEADWQYLNPPQPPPADPRLVEFGQRNNDYLNRLRAKVGPERAGQFLNWVDQRLVNMGLQRNSSGYFERGRDMLELDSARVTGVAYDPNTQALTADEAAKISNLDAKTYNSYAAAYQKAKAQGRVG